MTDPRFYPRKYCEPPEHFGTARIVTWPDDAGMSASVRDQLGAAKLQHKYARWVRDLLEGDHMTVETFANIIDMNYTRLGRILRGDIVMRVEDIVNFDRNLKLRNRSTATTERSDRD